MNLFPKKKKQIIPHVAEIIQLKDSQDSFAAGYIQCLEDLSRELRDASSYTILGMVVPMAHLQEKARKLVKK